MAWLASFSDFFSGLSFTEGLVMIILCGGGSWIYRMQQRQISRLASENRHYREIFLQMMNREFKLRSDETDETSTNSGGDND